jgi:hypothetical protein
LGPGWSIIPRRAWSTCMLRRLFHSPGTIGFYSPEPLKADRQEPGYTQLRGWRYTLKTQKPVSSTYNLRTPTGDLILFPVSGGQLQFFRAKTPPEEAVGMVGTEVSALFRIECCSQSARSKSAHYEWSREVEQQSLKQSLRRDGRASIVPILGKSRNK